MRGAKAYTRILSDRYTVISSLPQLYSFRRCPYAMRARMALAYSGCTVQLREVKLAAKPPELLQLSAKATVPVLYHEQKVIEQSLDIMYWALAKHDPATWLQDAQLSQQLILHCDQYFKPLLDKYKYSDRQPRLSQPEHRAIALPFLQQLNRRLNQQAFLLGQQIRLCDVAIFPFIRQFAHVDKTWFEQSGLTHLRRWLEYWLTTELFLSIMKKYQPWQQGDQVTIFP